MELCRPFNDVMIPMARSFPNILGENLLGENIVEIVLKYIIIVIINAIIWSDSAILIAFISLGWSAN